ncbi:hypothetical protein F5X97DRAFT_302395 [Nemania serpens]|nr:hypothetical protein F5X97DRAFT_302395 [Nemania serpens]
MAAQKVYATLKVLSLALIGRPLDCFSTSRLSRYALRKPLVEKLETIWDVLQPVQYSNGASFDLSRAPDMKL